MRALIRYWHLYSLDAPTVAVVWTYFVTQKTEVQISAPHLVAQFLTVWCIYLLDRILDSISLSDILTTRHFFHGQHRRYLSLIVLLVMPVIYFLTWHIPNDMMQAYYAISLAVIVYFLVVHVTKTKFPKEFFVGGIFSLAIFTPAFVTRPDLYLDLTTLALQFGATAWLNCLLIEHWERRKIRTNFSIYLSTIIIISAFCGASLFENKFFEISQYCLASMVLLFGLHAFRHCFSLVQLRASVDLALLTPAAFFLA